MRVIKSWILALTLIGVASSAAASAGQVDDILQRALAATGGREAWQVVGTLETEGRIAAGGQQGVYRAIEDVRGGRYVATFELGLLAGGQGFDGRVAWARRPGGDAAATDATAARRAAMDQAWLVARRYFLAEDEAALRYLRSLEDDGRRYEVLEASPPGGSTLQLWFDSASGLLARVQSVDTFGEQTEYLEDYRDVAGVRVPFRRLQRRGDPRYDVVIEADTVSVSSAADASAFALPEARPHDYRFTDSQRATTVPFDLVTNHVYLDVRVNGRPLRFLFDSGGVNLLTRTAADALGLESQGEIRGQGAGEGSVPIGLATVDTLELGGLVLENQTFFIAPLGDFASAHGVDFDGLVGYEVLRRLVVEIDYAARRLTLTQPEAFAYAGAARPIRIRFADRTPIVSGAIDGVPGEFSIDTGARNSLTLTSPFAAQNDLLRKYAASAERVVGWGIGGPVIAQVGRAGTLELGDAQVQWPIAQMYSGRQGAFADDTLAGNVGGGVLRRFTVTFDYARRYLYLEPNDDRDRPDLFDRSGLALQVRDGDLIVAHVAPDSPAARAGLQAGDRLRRVDGGDVTGASLLTVRERLTRDPSGTALRVDYDRDARSLSTSLTLEDLVPPDPREAGARRQAAVPIATS